MKIKSFWTYERGKWSRKENKFVDRAISPVTEKILDVEILFPDSKDYSPILKFIGGPTGYESYYIENLLTNDFKGEEFCICGGTINSWARCYVKAKDVNVIINLYKEYKMDLQELEIFKNKLEKKKSSRDQLIGQKLELKNQLEELGFSNLKQAEKTLEDLDTEIEDLELKLKEKTDNFKSKYKELLQ